MTEKKSPFERADEERTLWKTVAAIVGGLLTVAMFVFTKGRSKNV